MARSIIGIDIGYTSIKATCIDVTYKTRQVTHFYHIPVAQPEDPSNLWQAWQQALQNLKEQLPSTENTTFITALPSSWITTHKIHLPFIDTKKIDAAIEGELDYQQTLVDVEDLITSWTTIPQQDNASATILTASVKQSLLVQLLMLLTEVGMEPHYIVHPATSIATALKAATQYTLPKDATPQAKPIGNSWRMFLDIGHNSTKLCIVDPDQRVRVARTVSWGLMALDQQASKLLAISLEEAQQLRETEGRFYTTYMEPPSDEHKQLNQAYQQACSSLVQQIRVSLSDIRTGQQDDLITYIIGGGSLVKGFDSYLQTMLPIQLSRYELADHLCDAISNLTTVPKEHFLSASLAISAIRGKRNLLFDFRKGELAYHGETSWVKQQIIRSAIGTGAIIFFILVGSIIQYNVLSGLEERLDNEFCQITKQTLKKEICDPRAALSAMNPNGGPQADALPKYSAVDIFLMLSGQIPKTLEVTFTDLEIRLDRTIIKGQCNDFETLEKLVETLKNLTCISEVKQTRSSKKGNDQVDFGLTLKIECTDDNLPNVAGGKK